MKILITFTLMLSSLQVLAYTPFERLFPRNESYYYVQSSSSPDGDFNISVYGDENENEFFYNYNFTNRGPNQIVPTTPVNLEHPRRDYNFISEDHSKSETFLWMTDDNGSGKISDLFESILVFFPRLTQVEISQVQDEIFVTLPTEEVLIFDSKTKTIKSGVLEEEKLDLSSNRKFAEYKYTGKGIYIRANAKGNDPRLGGFAYIYKGDLKPCKVTKDEFWTQNGWPSFKFSDDGDVYKIIVKHCGSEYLP